MSYTIFIDPLPLSFTAADLAELLRPFGQVVSAKVACDSLGQSLRFGYVKMETAEAADNVCKNLNRTVLRNDVLTVLRTESDERSFGTSNASVNMSKYSY
jgi:RNA recognition motif-containing protein